jgi:hypothetical protein
MRVVGDLVDWRRSVGWFRHGSHDPTTRIGDNGLVRSSWTPDGPGTVAIRLRGDRVQVDVWGPGGPWLGSRGAAMAGHLAIDPVVPDAHPVVTAAARRFPGVRPVSSGNLYHELLPTIIAQRITSGEARRQWRRMCVEWGRPAPGPFPQMRTPPSPEFLGRHPTWAFHRLGIERSRAATLTSVASHVTRLWEWSSLSYAETAPKLALLGGIGPWTVGSVGGPALGDSDAVAVGDYHLPNIAAWALAGEARGDDRRMLELLEPFRGVRGHVLRLLVFGGHRPPSFGPRQRILPMYRW